MNDRMKFLQLGIEGIATLRPHEAARAGFTGTTHQMFRDRHDHGAPGAPAAVPTANWESTRTLPLPIADILGTHESCSQLPLADIKRRKEANRLSSLHLLPHFVSARPTNGEQSRGEGESVAPMPAGAAR